MPLRHHPERVLNHILSSQKRTLTRHVAKHAPGLQSAADFGRTERELHAMKDEQLKKMAPEDSGKNAETVYRDKKGKKLDMLNEFMRQQAVREGKVCHAMCKICGLNML